ncbi:RAD52 motif-containing protein 1 isoform X5 [Lathamus discolor]|uniref:RAD52 motif-containing protein 1 isoform X5 n=1 Tax=Lathamus discolor TaxID=678569 RepID=UPI0032B7C95D
MAQLFGHPEMFQKPFFSLSPQHSLFSAFSRFGPLYSVRARRNAAVAGPGYCAVIKFYSAGDASRAQHACNGQRLFQKSPLKVCVCTKQKGLQQKVLALSSNKCQELANHYLGFNGWSSRIITTTNGGILKAWGEKAVALASALLPYTASALDSHAVQSCRIYLALVVRMRTWKGRYL